MDPETALAVAQLTNDGTAAAAVASSRGYAYLGAGLAAIGMGATALGLGQIFGNYLSGALRNPSAADGQFGRLIFGFAVTEALGIFSLLVALLLLFTV